LARTSTAWYQERATFALGETRRRPATSSEIATNPMNKVPERAVAAASEADAVVAQTLDHLARRIRIQQAILFGSHARGEADQWSDVDLAVVSPNFEQMSHRQVIDLLVEVALAVDPRVEIRAYTPRELTEARPTNFLGHILATGAVVYGRGAPCAGGRAAPQRKPPRRGAVHKRKWTV
jgi:predicted nucleotidyltransferase